VILLRGAYIIISTLCSSLESLLLPSPKGKEEDNSLICQWKKRKRIRSIIEIMHIKERDTLLGRDLPLSTTGVILALEVSIVKPKGVEEILEVFPALLYWTIRACNDLKIGEYIKDRSSSLQNILKDHLALSNSWT